MKVIQNKDAARAATDIVARPAAAKKGHRRSAGAVAAPATELSGSLDRRALPTEGKIACFVVLVGGVFAIAKLAFDASQLGWWIVPLAVVLILTPLCLLCRQPSLMQLVLRETGRCVRCFASGKQPEIKR